MTAVQIDGISRSSTSKMGLRERIRSSELKEMISVGCVISFAVLGLTISSLVAVSIYRSRSTLASRLVGDVSNPQKALCRGQDRLWPPTSLEDAFPAYSPNGEYYAVVKELWPWESRHRLLEIRGAKMNLLIGRYVSSRRALRVYCWAQDSSGIFVADLDPGSSSVFLLFNKPSERGPIKILLVPER